MSECIDWTGATTQGYGTFGKGVRAHVAAYKEAYGPLPEGKQVNHRCGRRLCVNPEHLYAGDKSQNAQDSASYGTLNTVVLTEEEVRDIRSFYELGVPQKDLASMYDVHKHTIWCIVHRKTWKHVA